MVQLIWDTRSYLFWLLVVSIFCATVERLRPWRAEQAMFRPQSGQDVFWLFFNGHIAGIIVARVGPFVFARVMPVIEPARSIGLFGTRPGWVQFLVFLIVKDLLE